MSQPEPTPENVEPMLSVSEVNKLLLLLPTGPQLHPSGKYFLNRRLEANRENARKSTGPRTAQGKKRVARNAIKHGLTAETEINTRFEYKGEFERFQAQMHAQFAPASPEEIALVDRITSLHWRLKRIPLVESSYIDRITEDGRELALQNEAKTYSNLSRYEGQLDRCLHRALKELKEIQTARHAIPYQTRTFLFIDPPKAPSSCALASDISEVLLPAEEEGAGDGGQNENYETNPIPHDSRLTAHDSRSADETNPISDSPSPVVDSNPDTGRRSLVTDSPSDTGRRSLVTDSNSDTSRRSLVADSAPTYQSDANASLPHDPRSQELAYYEAINCAMAILNIGPYDEFNLEELEKHIPEHLKRFRPFAIEEPASSAIPSPCAETLAPLTSKTHVVSVTAEGEGAGDGGSENYETNPIPQSPSSHANTIPQLSGSNTDRRSPVAESDSDTNRQSPIASRNSEGAGDGGSENCETNPIQPLDSHLAEAHPALSEPDSLVAKKNYETNPISPSDPNPESLTPNASPSDTSRQSLVASRDSEGDSALRENNEPNPISASDPNASLSHNARLETHDSRSANETNPISDSLWPVVDSYPDTGRRSLVTDSNSDTSRQSLVASRGSEGDSALRENNETNPISASDPNASLPHDSRSQGLLPPKLIQFIDPDDDPGHESEDCHVD